MSTIQTDQSKEIARESFLRFHDAYLEAWREGMERGDAAGIVPYYRDLRSVYYARPGWDALEQVSAETSASGVQQTIDGLPGFRHVVSDRVVFVRSEREVAVSFRKSIENDERQYIALMLQVWCRSEDDDAKWLLVRETVEK